MANPPPYLDPSGTILVYPDHLIIFAIDGHYIRVWAEADPPDNVGGPSPPSDSPPTGNPTP